MSRFVDHVEEAQAMKPVGGREAELEAQSERQRAWLKRGRSAVTPAAAATTRADWRPKKKYRVSARNWILYLDNQV